MITLAKLNQRHALIERVVTLAQAGNLEAAHAAIISARLRRTRKA